jgi:hypothetical protein
VRRGSKRPRIGGQQREKQENDVKKEERDRKKQFLNRDTNCNSCQLMLSKIISAEMKKRAKFHPR